MRTLVILAHADPSVLPIYRAAIEHRSLVADVVLVNAFVPGKLSSAYRDLARAVRRGGSILAGLLERFPPPRPWRSYDRTVLATFSAGYGLAAELLASAVDAEQLDGYAAIDSYHAGLEHDGTADDTALAPLVAFALRARECRAVLRLGHSDVPTPQAGPSAYASTTQVAAELLRLAGGAGGGFSVQAFDLVADAKREHGLALTKWGPDLVADVVVGAEQLDRTVAGQPDERAAVRLGDVALQLALAELARGAGERPPGSNAGPDIETYFKPARVLGGAPLGVLSGDWCAVSACWCSFEAAARLRTAPPHAYLGRVRELWASAWANGAARAAELVRAGVYVPQPGDLWIGVREGNVHRPGRPGPDDDFAPTGLGHAARFITSPNGEGFCETIDGNHGATWGRVARDIAAPTFVGVVSYGSQRFEVTGAELRALRALPAVG